MFTNTLIVRADASIAMGTGHVMRCLALAQGWQDAGGNVAFAMAQSTPAVDARLHSERMEIVRLKDLPNSVEDAREIAALAYARDTACVVVDGYQFDSEYQRNLKSAGLKLLFVDDLGQCKHYSADLVLDQNVHACEKMYVNREPYTRLLLGPDYSLLRREFHARRDWRRGIPAIGRRLLVTMGGSDPDNFTLRLIEMLPKISIPDLEVAVVAGGSNPKIAELQQTVANLSMPIHLVGNATNMLELMAQSDVAIICAGGTLWELLYMGCATLSYFRTPTQRQIITELDAMGAVRSMGWVDDFEPDSLAHALEQIIACQGCREQMARLGKNLVDGKGVSRILSQVLPENVLPENTDRPRLRTIAIETDEREQFLEMAHQHFRELNPAFMPAHDWENSYFDRIKGNPKYELRWIVSDGQRVGFILFGMEEHRFLPRQTGVIYEVFVVPERRREGIARACAKKIIDELWKASPSKIQLEVVEGNAAAAELWISLGFQKVTERFVLTEQTSATE
jgi:UDP-2,4-diacetamido-2,4,6-trideoxy-beta-L-altropyranose hydrolase